MKKKALLLSIIVVLLLLFYFGGLSYIEAGSNNSTQDTPVITWVAAEGQLINNYHSIAGLLQGCTIFEYFEVTGGSGEVEITADDKKGTFNVEEGKSYKLSIEVNITETYQYSHDDFTVEISSPSAETTVRAILEGSYDGGTHNVIIKEITEMNLEQWECSEPKRPLAYWPIPEGSDTTTYYDSYGRATHRKYTGKFYPEEDYNSIDVTWGSDQYVAVGKDAGAIFTSPDGINWTGRESETDKYLSSISWSGSQFMVLGNSGTILTSSDGITWTGRESETDKNLFSVSWSGSQFMVVGASGAILTSSDGITWEKQSSVDFLTHDVVWDGSQFVTVGDCGTIGRSPDGVNWELVNLDEELGVWGLASITWSGSQFVAVGWDGTIVTSPEGETWTEQGVETDGMLKGIVWNGSQFVAVGEEGIILTSPDGKTWEEQSSGVGGNLRSITWSGDQFVAVGNSGYGTILVSSDGKTWTVVADGEVEEVDGICKYWAYNDKNETIKETYEFNGKELSYTVGPGGLRYTNFAAYDNYDERTFFDYQTPAFAIRTHVQEAEKLGKINVGLYDPSDGVFHLKDIEPFRYGPRSSDWLSVAGEWNSDGNSSIGLYDSSDGVFHLSGLEPFRFGPRNSDWLPVAGDWNGDGRENVGLYDPSDGVFHLRGETPFRFGPRSSEWLPVSGDWNGDGYCSVGLYDPSDGVFHLSGEEPFRFGPRNSNWLPLPGDWDGEGSFKVGLYDPADGVFHLKDKEPFRFGPRSSDWLPVSGRW